MKNKSFILGLITLLCLITTVILWFAVNRSNVDYKEVQVNVLSAEDRYIKIKGKKTLFHDVKVLYQGDTLDLKNAHDISSYTPGQSLTAYLSNGNLYADVAGVKTSTKLSMVYFGFMFLTFAMLMVWAGYSSHIKKKREESQTH